MICIVPLNKIILYLKLYSPTLDYYFVNKELGSICINSFLKHSDNLFKIVTDVDMLHVFFNEDNALNSIMPSKLILFLDVFIFYI